MELIHRQRCVDATLARFLAAKFEWGKTDCVRMAVFLVRQMGHKVTLAKAGGYSSAKGAVRALKRAGYDSIEAALDARFERIAPAASLPGDILALPSEAGLSALTVCVGNNAVMSALGGGFALIAPKLEMATAWRVPYVKGRKHG